jgi:hypothetical protein
VEGSNRNQILGVFPPFASKERRKLRQDSVMVDGALPRFKWETLKNEPEKLPLEQAFSVSSS